MDVFKLNRRQNEWVDETLGNMSVEVKVGQVINIAIGFFDKKLQKDMLDKVERYQPGSAISGGLPWRTMRGIMQKVNARLKIPMAVNADFEMGPCLTDGAHFPHAMGMAAIADTAKAERLVYAAGETSARQGRPVGIQWALAPVVDINANFRNPITNIRSCGDDPARVKRLTGAYIRGLQDHGMAATSKHFPGDGFSDLDQHKLTTVNPLSRKDWFRLSGAMFQNAIDTGVLTIMPGHIACPALDPSRNSRGRPIPATFSKRLLQDVLRGEMGFTGLLVSDAFQMGGTLEHVKTIPEACVRSLAAGMDVVLMIFMGQLESVYKGILAAVKDKTLPMKRLDEAVERNLKLKARLGLNEPGFMGTTREALRVFEPCLHAKEALEASRLSITKSHDIVKAIPFKKGKVKRVLVNLLNEEQFWGEDGVKLFGNKLPEYRFIREFRKRGVRVDVTEDPGEGQTAKVAHKYDAIIYMFNNGPQASRCNVMPCRQALRDMDWTVINGDKPVVFVALRSPYLRYYLPGIPNCVLTYANSAELQTALVEALFGEIPFKGRLPVKLPDPYGIWRG